MNTSALKFNSLLVEACDDKCLTSPSLWTQMCQYFNGKALAFDNVELADIKDAIIESDAKSIYIYPLRLNTPNIQNNRGFEGTIHN